jgi:hypothetical protein
MEGPIWVRGGILIESAEGHIYECRNRLLFVDAVRALTNPSATAATANKEKDLATCNIRILRDFEVFYA